MMPNCSCALSHDTLRKQFRSLRTSEGFLDLLKHLQTSAMLLWYVYGDHRMEQGTPQRLLHQVAAPATNVWCTDRAKQ